jgi:hypothetical protein
MFCSGANSKKGEFIENQIIAGTYGTFLVIKPSKPKLNVAINIHSVQTQPEFIVWVRRPNRNLTSPYRHSSWVYYTFAHFAKPSFISPLNILKVKV